eukprot:6259179-Amphidinium_carterae.1
MGFGRSCRRRMDVDTLKHLADSAVNSADGAAELQRSAASSSDAPNNNHNNHNNVWRHARLSP